MPPGARGRSRKRYSAATWSRRSGGSRTIYAIHFYDTMIMFEKRNIREPLAEVR
jgi:hypothetical protein